MYDQTKSDNKHLKAIIIIIGLVGRVFANDLGDRDSIPGRVIPKTQQYKVRIKGKVEQFWERSSTLPYTSV